MCILILAYWPTGLLAYWPTGLLAYWPTGLGAILSKKIAISCVILASIVSAANADQIGQAILADNPLGFWQLYDAAGSGTAIDISGYGHNGTVVGAVTQGVAGFYGTHAASFAGGYVSVADPSGTNWGSANNMSVEAWYWESSLPAGSPDNGAPGWASDLVSNGQDSAPGSWQLYRQQQSEVTPVFQDNDIFGLGGPGGGDAWASSSPAAGSWHQVVGTTDAATLTTDLYIDGQLVATGPYGLRAIDTTTEDLEIGNITGWDYPFLGSISNVAVFGYALTADQVKIQYAAAPEPGSWAVLGLGALGLFVRRRAVKRRS